MIATSPQFLTVSTGAAERRIAVILERPTAPGETSSGATAVSGTTPATGLIWLPGFKSEMTSTKASYLAAFARARGLAMTRLDYSGHGQSPGKVEEGTLGRWLEEVRTVFTRCSEGPQIVIGSSMGGNLALLLLRELMRTAPNEAARIKALVLIAPAWDMTRLMWERMSESARREITERGIWMRPSRYGDGPYPITRALIENGRQHLISSEPLDPGRPVHILHGLQDADVPWEHTLDLVAHLSGDWTRVEAVPDGDHRLSTPPDLELLAQVVSMYL